MTEAGLLKLVLQMAALFGYRSYHARPARTKRGVGERTNMESSPAVRTISRPVRVLVAPSGSYTNAYREASMSRQSIPVPQGVTIGQTMRRKQHTFVWAACEGCGKQRWVKRDKGRPTHPFCVSCSIRRRHQLPIIDTPPKVGEVRHGKQIGRPRHHKFRWSACPVCGKERWLDVACPSDYRCHACGNRACRGPRNHYWRGGRRVTDDGYIEVKVYDDDPYFPMATTCGYVREHRLVMARHVGRCLLPWEIVHHKNCDKQDNDLANLELKAGNEDHVIFALAELTKLRKENKRLRGLLAALGVDPDA